ARLSARAQPSARRSTGGGRRTRATADSEKRAALPYNGRTPSGVAYRNITPAALPAGDGSASSRAPSPGTNTSITVNATAIEALLAPLNATAHAPNTRIALA